MGFKLKTLLMGDLFAAGLSFYFALYLRFGFKYAPYELFSKPLLRVVLYAVLLVTSSYIFDLYSVSKQRNNRDVMQKILQSVCVSFLGLSAIIFLNPDWMIGRGLLAISLSSFVLFQFGWHILFRMVFHLQYLAQHIIVVGTGQAAQKVGKLIKSAENVNHFLAGFVSCDESRASDVCVPDKMILGDMKQLLEIITRVSATELIITNSQQLENNFHKNLLLNSKLLGVEISDVPTYFERVTGKLMLENMDLNTLIYSAGFKRSSLVTAIKRFFDIMISAIGMVIALPIFPIIALLVKLNLPGPLFYRQVRVGYMGNNFTLYKFRTMSNDAESDSGAVWSQENDPRIRPIGKFLRKSRLDELPQLYNVLIGDMSFIGPRPERPEFVDKLQVGIPFYAKRHFLKPGITGWAQIKHPYGASVEDSFEKLRYDLYYFKHMNLIMDAKIFLKTIKVIILQYGGR